MNRKKVKFDNDCKEFKSINILLKETEDIKRRGFLVFGRTSRKYIYFLHLNQV